MTSSFSQKTSKEQITRLRAVFETLAEAGLKLKPSKCKFFKRQIAYLGHIVSNDGIETDPKETQGHCELAQTNNCD